MWDVFHVFLMKKDEEVMRFAIHGTAMCNQAEIKSPPPSPIDDQHRQLIKKTETNLLSQSDIVR